MAGRRDANACVTSRASGVEALQNASLGKELTRRGFDSIKERLGNARRGIALRIIPGGGMV